MLLKFTYSARGLKGFVSWTTHLYCSQSWQWYVSHLNVALINQPSLPSFVLFNEKLVRFFVLALQSLSRTVLQSACTMILTIPHHDWHDSGLSQAADSRVWIFIVLIPHESKFSLSVSLAFVVNSWLIYELHHHCFLLAVVDALDLKHTLPPAGYTKLLCITTKSKRFYGKISEDYFTEQIVTCYFLVVHTNNV